MAGLPTLLEGLGTTEVGVGGTEVVELTDLALGGFLLGVGVGLVVVLGVV